MKKVAVILAILLVFVGLVSCNATKANEEETPTATEPIAEQETPVEENSETEAEPITLVTWDEYTEGTANDANNQFIAMFEEEYPNVTVERVPKSMDILADTLQAAFLAGNAPDVFYYEQGIGACGGFLKGGYLLNLADAYKEYGWDVNLSPAASSTGRVGDYIYGVGCELETMGLYYNKDIFTQLGLQEPKTIEELDAEFATIKEAGYIPLANTMGEGWWNNMNTIGTILYGYMTTDEIEDIMLNDASWDIPSVRQAVDRIQQWIEKDYFVPSPETDADLTDIFLRQEAVFSINGNWIISDLDAQAEFEVGYIPFPGAEGNDKSAQVNFVGSGYIINAKSQNVDMALKYVDFIVNRPETATVWMNVAQKIPTYIGEYDSESSDLQKVILGYLGDESVNNRSGINMWLGTNGFDFFSTAGQRLIVGGLDADSFMEELVASQQKDIEEQSTKASFTFD